MSDDKFKSYCFKHSMLMDYIHPRTKERISCMVIGINFDEELIKVFVMPNDTYKEDEFWTRYENIEKPLNILKPIK